MIKYFHVKGRKWKRKVRVRRETLSEEDLQFLIKRTNYEEEEINEWYR